MSTTTFTLDKKKFVAYLHTMQSICSKRTTLPATNNILFHVSPRELTLKGTDLEVSLQSSCPLPDCSCEAPQAFLVPGRRIFDVVKELDEQVTCTFTDRQMLVQSGPVKLALHIYSPDEFPPFPERIENLMHLERNDMLELLNSVSFLVPQHNSNPALNGLLLEISADHLTMTATDGHCLAQARSTKYTVDGNYSWLLPRRAIFELKKLLENSDDQTVFLGICGNQLVFSGENFNFYTKLLVDAFPQYAQILNTTGFYQGSINSARFTKTLKRANCLLSGHFLATRFEFASSNVHVTLQNKEIGSLDETVALDSFDGDTVDIRFYAPYILNGLANFKHDTIAFSIKNSTLPLIFHANNDHISLTYLVMPVSHAS